MLSEMERTVTNKLTCKFSGLHPKNKDVYRRWKLEGSVREEDLLPSSHASMVFDTNPFYLQVFKLP